MAMITLFREDFKSYRVGDFPYETFLGAMGEYHYRPKEWYGGQWYDPTPLPGTGGIKSWMIMEQDGKKYIEYSARLMDNVRWLLILATGDDMWTDYRLSATVRKFLTKSQAGILFRYQNSQCFYNFCLDNGKIVLYKKHYDEVTTLASQPFDYSSDTYCHLTVDAHGDEFRCCADGKPVFTVRDSTYRCGRIALGTLGVSRFTDITVEMEEEEYRKIVGRKHDAEIETASERRKYPLPLLWKVIDFKNFGAGRNIRFGHLLGGKGWQIVIAQNQRRVHRDAFGQISCLTALDLNGDILWQIGEPNPKEHALITTDLPFQVYDIDGDGRDEVITSRDFKLLILDGATGKVKKWVYTPYIHDSVEYLNIGGVEMYPFDRLNVDAIRICDLSGKGRPTDLIIKDRYRKIWAYDSGLHELWSYDAGVNTGHFPFSKDINGDGREEVYVGYDLLTADGQKIWSLPIDTDHTDEIVIGKIDPDRDEIIGIVSGWEGFMLVDLQGNILVRHKIGHAQRISVGNYRPDLPGLEICVTTYHRNQGIILLYDCKGNLLWTKEPSTNGNVITPVNWSGDGQDLILLNGNNPLGGMIDGHYRQVVRFPDDGHPEMCAEAMDLTGDCRDEIVLWDTDRMFIYTQSDGIQGDSVYCPVKYPPYNASNYRGEYSYPR